MTISPGLQAALENLARVTVRTGADPGKVILFLKEMVEFKRDVWPTLTPQQRYAFRTKLRHLHEEAERRAAAARAGTAGS
jgi:hypothetical protein